METLYIYIIWFIIFTLIIFVIEYKDNAKANDNKFFSLNSLKEFFNKGC